MDKVTIEQLIEKLFAAVRQSDNVKGDFEFPFMELIYDDQQKCWGLFMKSHTGKSSPPPELFYKKFSSVEEAFEENVAFYEGRWTPPPKPEFDEFGNFANRKRTDEERAASREALAKFFSLFAKYKEWKDDSYE